MDEDLKEFLMNHVITCVGKMPNNHSEMNDYYGSLLNWVESTKEK